MRERLAPGQRTTRRVLERGGSRVPLGTPSGTIPAYKLGKSADALENVGRELTVLDLKPKACFQGDCQLDDRERVELRYAAQQRSGSVQSTSTVFNAERLHNDLPHLIDHQC